MVPQYSKKAVTLGSLLAHVPGCPPQGHHDRDQLLLARARVDMWYLQGMELQGVQDSQ